MKHLSSKVVASFAVFGLGLMVGCSAGSVQGATSGTSDNIVSAFHGTIHGGPNPVVGARVVIYSTSSSGYGVGNMLQEANQTGSSPHQDTDGNGSFSFAGGFTCPQGQYAYVVAYGGNTGANASNPNSILVTPVGSCDTMYSGTTYTGGNLWINELTTVAMGYALSNFINVTGNAVNGYTVGIGGPATNSATAGCIANSFYTTSNGFSTNCTTTTAAGLKHAFQNAMLLVDNHSGNPVATTSNGAIVPVQEIKTLGNILQACVNSRGGGTDAASGAPTTTTTASGTSHDGTPCGKLFAYSSYTVDGTTTGTLTAAGNTLDAIKNLAKRPAGSATLFDTACSSNGTGSTSAATCIYNLAAATGFYQSALTSAPPDWMLGISYRKASLSTGASTTGSACSGAPTTRGLTYPMVVSVDIDDNVTIMNYDASAAKCFNLIRIRPDGTPFASTDFDTNTLAPIQTVTDGYGHIIQPISGSTAALNGVQIYASSPNSSAITLLKTLVNTDFGLASTVLINPKYVVVDPSDTIYFDANYANNSTGKAVVSGAESFNAPAYTGSMTGGTSATMGQISLDPAGNSMSFAVNTAGAARVYGLAAGGSAVALTNHLGGTSANFYNALAADSSSTAGYGIYINANSNPTATLVSKFTYSAIGGSFSFNTQPDATAPTYTFSTLTSGPISAVTDSNNVIWFGERANVSPTPGHVRGYDTVHNYGTPAYVGCQMQTATTTVCGTTSLNNSIPYLAFSVRSLAIDAAGDIWVANGGQGGISEIFGLAAPTFPSYVKFTTTMASANPAPAGPVTTVDSTTQLADFEGAAGEPAVTTTAATASMSTDYATVGAHSLRVDMQANQPYPGFRFNFSPNKNWGAYPGIAFDVYNPQSTAVKLRIRMDDPTTAPTEGDGTTILPPKAWTTAVFMFEAPYPQDVDMKTLPLLPGYGLMTGGGEPIAGTSVADLILYVPATAAPTTLYYDNMRLINPYDNQTARQSAKTLLFQQIVDRYGQFTKASWAEKVLADSDLASNTPLPSPPAYRDRYGGSTNLSGYGASGFFKTTKLTNGTWWFVDPDGNLFFSAGVDSVGTEQIGGAPYRASSLTYVGSDPVAVDQTPRFTWFSALPSSADPLAIYYAHGTGEGHYCDTNTSSAGCAYDFFSANLQRKYGTSNFIATWDREVLDRLEAWGFNTIGDFSDPVLAQGTATDGSRIPYTIKAAVTPSRSLYKNITVTLVKGSYQIADPFDTAFEPAMETTMTNTLNNDTNSNPGQMTSDPYLIGYFVDNEIPWSNNASTTPASATGADDATYFPVPYAVLASPSSEPAKLYWEQSVLMPEYSNNIANLNTAWGTAYASWPDFMNSTAQPTIASSAMRADFSTFLGFYAQQYYRLVAQAVHAKDPNHLYLGSKYSGFTPEVVAACGMYCDVISFDLYATSIDPVTYSAMLLPTNKPALSGEFHFGALDRGMFSGGLVPVADQSARATAYDSYLRSLCANPLFIGAHWYQYADEPLTGRQSDGEDYEIGLVTVTDKPYPELTTGVRATNSIIYDPSSGGRFH
ncbi:hypothetical protein ACFQBQ_13125 [Granulicella cerasi]|uniref:Uncharacterized protein n=1 Tax=Granulicella cerasi TaxID=741063 RepID=A0ABW1ZAP6_9BACT|nr:hypothetical protein [Granulicella cerasi]